MNDSWYAVIFYTIFGAIGLEILWGKSWGKRQKTGNEREKDQIEMDSSECKDWKKMKRNYLSGFVISHTQFVVRPVDGLMSNRISVHTTRHI